MTEYEAQKLKESMYRELNAGPRAVWQCVAGLLIVLGLGVTGSAFYKGVDDASAVAKAQAQPRQASMTSGGSEAQHELYPESRLAAETPQDVASAAR